MSDEAPQLDGAWIEHCTDYAAKVPLVELARRSVYLREYLYVHERSTPRTPELRAEKDALVRRILEKSPLATLGGQGGCAR